MTGLRVGLDIGVVKKGFALVDAGEGIADVRLAGANRLYLAAFELNPSFVAIEDVKIAQGLAINYRLGSHDRAWKRDRNLGLIRRTFEGLVG